MNQNLEPELIVGQTATACETVLWNMVIHPDVQRKVQAELDEVFGHNHLPSPTHNQHLGYLQAVWRESMRLNPPVPLGSQSSYNLFNPLTIMG